MGVEIERKFLVTGRGYRSGVSHRIRQGYLNLDPDRTVRVRLADGKAFITIKGRGLGTRQEFEYEIPASDADQMLNSICVQPIIEKTRYTIVVGQSTFEVDEFDGDNAGLTIAEVELDDQEQQFGEPDWLGAEVTQDPRYANANLVRRPYRSW
jgi:adenylate cyclase